MVAQSKDMHAAQLQLCGVITVNMLCGGEHVHRTVSKEDLRRFLKLQPKLLCTNYSTPGSNMISDSEDADLAAEALATPRSAPPVDLRAPSGPVSDASALSFVPLIMNGRTFQKTGDTELLLHRIGGGAALHRLTAAFYVKMFQDRHLDQFVRSHDDPHAARLANWIIEKMGGEGDVWSQERMERSRCPVTVHLPIRGDHVVHDRTSAHVAAWFSPKRTEKSLGDHFKLHDARVWMRLMFWACREEGLFADPVFESWFTRFMAHFVRVYESMGPYFARDSARWSANPENLQAYAENGYQMPASVLGPDGCGVPVQEAIRQVPAKEINDSIWPYNSSERYDDSSPFLKTTS